MKATYANALVRGRMRSWKQRLEDQFEPLRDAPDNDEILLVAGDYILRNTVKGQMRALKKLKGLLGPGARLHAHRLIDRGKPYALWRYIAPQATLFPETADRELLQDCVAVGYLVVSRNGVARNGLWGLIIPDHAIGRAIDRSGEIAPRHIVESAHTNLLRLRVGAVLPNGRIDPQHSFNLGSSGGCFISHLDYHRRVSARPWVFAHTWISEDMRHEQQTVLTEDGIPGEQLGDQWLLPRHLQDIDDRPQQRPFGGKVAPCDLRGEKFTGEFVQELIECLATTAVVWCDYGDGRTGQFLKGEDIVHGETSNATKLKVAWLRVANTTTIELLGSGLILYEKGEVTPSTYKNLARTLTVAATLPGGVHDEPLFEAAMGRSFSRRWAQDKEKQ